MRKRGEREGRGGRRRGKGRRRGEGRGKAGMKEVRPPFSIVPYAAIKTVCVKSDILATAGKHEG